MNRRGIALAVLALTVPVAGASAQSGVEDCIAQNGARYTSPEDATSHQYVGPAARCADAQDDDTDVQITPVGGAKPGGGTTTPAPRAQTPAPRAPEQPAPVAPTAPEPTPTPGTTTEGTPAKPPAAQAPTTGRGAAARQSVATALSAAQSGPGLSSALSPAGVPGSVVLAVLAGLGLAGAGAGMRRLNRR